MNRKSMMGKQSGVALLEALIGILIFSIGVLAVVGMQAAAVKNVAESKYRMDASFLANEIVGQMWANRANLASYKLDGGTIDPVAEGWVKKVSATLPGTDKNPPTIDIGVDNVVTVTIFWQHPDEANQSDPPAPHNYRVVTSINCC
jgi:type IV pilus assembly protein PilV